MEIIVGVCFIALALVVWFKTNAFVEYMTLFKLEKYLKVKDYNEVKPDLSFPEFINEYFHCFLTRLLICPICMSVWLGFPTILFAGISAYPIVVFLGLFLYLVTNKLL